MAKVTRFPTFAAALILIAGAALPVAAQSWRDRDGDRDRDRREERDRDRDRDWRGPGFSLRLGGNDDRWGRRRDEDCHWVVRRYRDEDGDWVERRRRICD
jgi:hypothetical protein